MAVTLGKVGDALATYLITDEDADPTVESNATGASSGTAYCFYGNNASSNSATYLKVSQNASPTNSSTIPDHMFYFPAGTAISYIVGAGHAWTTALSFWATSTAANGATQTDTGAQVTVRILTT